MELESEPLGALCLHGLLAEPRMATCMHGYTTLYALKVRVYSVPSQSVTQCLLAHATVNLQWEAFYTCCRRTWYLVIFNVKYLKVYMVCGAGSEMGKGDPGMEDIYHWDPVTGPRIAFKGPTGATGQSSYPCLIMFAELISAPHWSEKTQHACASFLQCMCIARHGDTACALRHTSAYEVHSMQRGTVAFEVTCAHRVATCCCSCASSRKWYTLRVQIGLFVWAASGSIWGRRYDGQKA